MSTMTVEKPRKVAPRAQVAAVRAAHAEQVTSENYAEFATLYAQETCSRCGGTGRMPFAAYGGVCFKCNGNGRHFTRAGRKAFLALEAARDEQYGVLWADVKVGDLVWWTDSRTWRRVLTIEALPAESLKINGVPVPCIKVTRDRKPDTTYHERLASTVRKHSVEAAVAVLRLAATLDGVQVTRRTEVAA